MGNAEDISQGLGPDRPDMSDFYFEKNPQGQVTGVRQEVLESIAQVMGNDLDSVPKTFAGNVLLENCPQNLKRAEYVLFQLLRPHLANAQPGQHRQSLEQMDAAQLAAASRSIARLVPPPAIAPLAQDWGGDFLKDGEDPSDSPQAPFLAADVNNPALVPYYDAAEARIRENIRQAVSIKQATNRIKRAATRITTKVQQARRILDAIESNHAGNQQDAEQQEDSVSPDAIDSLRKIAEEIIELKELIDDMIDAFDIANPLPEVLTADDLQEKLNTIIEANDMSRPEAQDKLTFLKLLARNIRKWIVIAGSGGVNFDDEVRYSLRSIKSGLKGVDFSTPAPVEANPAPENARPFVSGVLGQDLITQIFDEANGLESTLNNISNADGNIATAEEMTSRIQSIYNAIDSLETAMTTLRSSGGNVDPTYENAFLRIKQSLDDINPESIFEEVDGKTTIFDLRLLAHSLRRAHERAGGDFDPPNPPNPNRDDRKRSFIQVYLDQTTSEGDQILRKAALSRAGATGPVNPRAARGVIFPTVLKELAQTPGANLEFLGKRPAQRAVTLDATEQDLANAVSSSILPADRLRTIIAHLRRTAIDGKFRYHDGGEGNLNSAQNVGLLVMALERIDNLMQTLGQLDALRDDEARKLDADNTFAAVVAQQLRGVEDSLDQAETAVTDAEAQRAQARADANQGGFLADVAKRGVAGAAFNLGLKALLGKKNNDPRN